MRHFLNGPVRWVALGAGVLALAGVISVAVWLVQRGDGPGAVTEAASDGANPSTGPASSDATLSDSVELDVRGGGPATDETEAVQTEDAAGAGLTAADEATVSDSVELEVQHGEAATGEAEGVQHEDDAAANVQDGSDLTKSDSAELTVQPGQPVPRRGSGDVAAMADSADLVVRDASGNIKQHETVR